MEIDYEREQDEIIIRSALLKLWSRLLLMLKTVSSSPGGLRPRRAIRSRTSSSSTSQAWLCALSFCLYSFRSLCSSLGELRLPRGRRPPRREGAKPAGAIHLSAEAVASLHPEGYRGQHPQFSVLRVLCMLLQPFSSQDHFIFHSPHSRVSHLLPNPAAGPHREHHRRNRQWGREFALPLHICLLHGQVSGSASERDRARVQTVAPPSRGE